VFLAWFSTLPPLSFSGRVELKSLLALAPLLVVGWLGYRRLSPFDSTKLWR